jgi:uncharacterized protein
VIIVADTSALYAAFDAQHSAHRGAAEIVARQTLILSPLVVGELDHLAHRDLGFPAVMSIMDSLNQGMFDGQYRLATLSPDDLATAHQVRLKYEGLRLDLADAVGVVLADRFKTNRILTLDERDFRTIRPLGKAFEAFRILPADPLD